MLPFALVVLSLGLSVVFLRLLKSLYAPFLFSSLFWFLFLLQFLGCIAEVQIHVILIGRNIFRDQFSKIHSKNNENVMLFWTSNLTFENLS